VTARRDAFAAAVRAEPPDDVLALVLIAAEAGQSDAREPGEEAAGVRTRLDELAAAARPHVVAARSAAEGLRRALGDEAGFGGTPADYDDLRASLLPDVLRRRRGLPVLLSVVWVQVAGRLGLAAHCVGAPGHVVAAVDGVLVDPFAGGALLGDRPDLAAFPPLSGVPLLLRVLTNIRALAARRQDGRTELWATELSLLLPAHPAELRREHGALLVRAGRFLEGARQLEEFAAVAPPPHDEQARRQARMARARLN
jgi:hypothetical protein